MFVRKLSRYWPNLERLNERFRSEGRAPVIIKEADQNLQDEDILDMVNAGLVGVTIMDDLIAEFWAKVYDSNLRAQRFVISRRSLTSATFTSTTSPTKWRQKKPQSPEVRNKPDNFLC